MWSTANITYGNGPSFVFLSISIHANIPTRSRKQVVDSSREFVLDQSRKDHQIFRHAVQLLLHRIPITAIAGVPAPLRHDTVSFTANRSYGPHHTDTRASCQKLWKTSE